MKYIDINCDMGESFGNYQIGQDMAIFPYISSTNIACGFHGGDPMHMERTIKAAVVHLRTGWCAPWISRSCRIWQA